MENPIKVCTIDGISFPIIHDDFIDMSLPHVGCFMCKYAICARCVELFSFNHECKYKYFYVTRNEYICKLCDKKRNNELIYILKNKFQKINI